MTDADNIRRLNLPGSPASADRNATRTGASPPAIVTKLTLPAGPKLPWDSSAKAFYLDTVARLEVVAARTDLNDPKEFHDLLWLTVQLGASQTFIAYDQAKAPSMVSRWVSGEQTPMPHRRQGVIASALVSLRQAIDEGAIVPMRKYYGRRSKRTLHPLSG